MLFRQLLTGERRPEIMPLRLLHNFQRPPLHSLCDPPIRRPASQSVDHHSIAFFFHPGK